MTIEFPDEVEAATAPHSSGVMLRNVLPWSAPALLVAVALFLPVTRTLLPGDRDAVGTFRAAVTITLHPFGSYTASDAPGTAPGGPAYGWVWLGLLVAFVAVAGWASVRRDSPWPGVVGVVAGGTGVGCAATLVLTLRTSSTSRAVDVRLAPGVWVALAGAVLGIVAGVLAVGQATRANAGG